MDKACEVCGGSGRTSQACPKCHGAKKQQFGFLIWRFTMICGKCYANAVGTSTGYLPCKKCRGTGSRFAY